MPARPALLSALVLAVAALVAGCNAGAFGGSASLSDRQSDQPLAADGHRAHMDIDYQWDFVRIHQHAAWTRGQTSRTVEEVVTACQNVLPRDAWIEAADTPPYPREPDRFADTRVIVCVDPIVAISVPIPDSADPADRLVEPGAGIGLFKVGRATVNPPRGYRYGTRIPYHPEVTAILPDDERRYARITPDSDGIARIPVPWGALELVPTAREWRVRAVRHDAH